MSVDIDRVNEVRITLDWQGRKFSVAYDLNVQTISSITSLLEGQLEAFSGKTVWAAKAFELIESVEGAFVDVDEDTDE